MIVDIPDTAIEWLRTGERGISSEAIFSHLTGVPVVAHPWRMSVPSDPSDLRRCLELLDRVPEFAARLHEMSTVNSQWARLVANWSELKALFEQEAPIGRCPRTWARMYELLHQTPMPPMKPTPAPRKRARR